MQGYVLVLVYPLKVDKAGMKMLRPSVNSPLLEQGKTGTGGLSAPDTHIASTQFILPELLIYQVVPTSLHIYV